MSQFHYIASPIELEVGSFGSNKTEIREIEIINPRLIRINLTKEIKFHFPIDKSKTVEDIKNELEVYETEEDAAGIFISSLYEGFSEVRRHFKNRFVYMISANFGDFIYTDNLNRLSIERYKANIKCKKVLFEYIRESLNQGEFMEFFSSWADEEGLERNKSLDTTIYLDETETLSDFKIEDRQYIRFYLSKK